ncbi:hypothetical protein OS493_033185 [Desmophyllum pertusum]|uniref:Uncharacterized protein n=1 Tax=Desmophyllum pertusum TaxID=174260 RepID=A0A9W9YBC2_9CNID|nr:hypothetical protein OS493_033185 [Desmophyllum pertusum]
MKSAPVQGTKNYVENLPFSPPSSDTGCSPLVFSASSPNTSIAASKDAGCSPLAFSSLSPNSSIGASCSPPAFGCSSPLASTSIGASKDVGCSPLAFGSSSPSTNNGASKNIGCSTLAFGSSSPNTSIGASKDIASSSERKRSGSSLIGYVRQVSPSKRNKRDTLDYFEVILQTEDSDRQRAVCYEKAKRPLFLSGQESKTPVKLTNFTTSDSNGDIFVNNITRVSQAEPGEYCFQYKEVRQSSGELNISVKQILETCRAMDVVDVTAKVLKKNLPRTVGKNNLQLVEAVINDGDCKYPARRLGRSYFYSGRR